MTAMNYPEVGEAMSHHRYFWTICYVSVIVTLVLILQVLDLTGAIG